MTAGPASPGTFQRRSLWVLTSRCWGTRYLPGRVSLRSRWHLGSRSLCIGVVMKSNEQSMWVRRHEGRVGGDPGTHTAHGSSALSAAAACYMYLSQQPGGAHSDRSPRTCRARVAGRLPGLRLEASSAAVSGRGQARGGALVTRSARGWCSVSRSRTVVACTCTCEHQGLSSTAAQDHIATVKG